MQDGAARTGPREAGLASMAGWLIGPVFLLLAVWFLWGPDLTDDPALVAAEVSREAVTREPLRAAPPEVPIAVVAGFEYRCLECHRLFPSLPETARKLVQHTHIRLDHGMNDRCFNCHDNEQRDRLVLSGGETIPFDKTPRLCAQCHGPTYRDWQMFMHGRTNGYWDETQGRRHQLSCTECHDPHVPAFGPMDTLPGPKTLRMVDEHEAPPAPAETPDRHNPLRQWSSGGGPSGTGEGS